MAKKGTGPRRSKKQREADFARLAEMYVRGWTQARIGQELGVTQAAISNDLKELHRRWREETTLALDDYKRKELAKLDELEREYWAAWERSQESRKTVKKRKSDMPGGVAELKEMIQSESCGDAKYLDGVLRCIDRRSKLLGLDAPERNDIRLTSGVDELTDAELDAIIYGGKRPKSGR